MKHWVTPLLFFLLKPWGLARVWALACCFLVLPAALAQESCMLLPLSLEERVQAAELVIEGKVVSQRSFWDENHENIYTAHQIEVYKIFKGEPTTQLVEIITEGGRVGLDLHVYSATLQLKERQQGVFFLQKPKTSAAKARYTVFGSMQGFIRYQLQDGTARDPFQNYTSIPLEVYGSLSRLSGNAPQTVKANKDLQQAITPVAPATQNQRRFIPLITSFSPTSLNAGTGEVLTITGTNFGATQGNGYVEFRDADDGGKSFIKPLPLDYLSWSDTQIRVKVPTYGIDGGTAGSGTFRVVNNDPNTATSPAPLTIVFAYANVEYNSTEYKIPSQSFLPRLISQNGSGGYTFRFGASFENNTPALHAFKRAMNEWSCSTYINWTATNRIPIATSAEDNINSVRFANAGELPANVLGRCISRYRGCIQGTNVFFWVKEMDLEFAQRSDWQFGPAPATNQQYDFQSVAVHELGHGHQLSHLNLPRAVMHYAVARGQVSRQLNSTNDIAGGNYAMALATASSPCAVDPMQPKPANACAIPVELLDLAGTFTGNNQVLLTWNTKSEEDLTQFILERSADGLNFSPIATIPATGGPGQPQNYQYIDTNPLPALMYYRLRLVKTNGTTELSDVIQVVGPAFVRQLAPNPGGNQTFLYFNAPEADNLQLVIYDLAGRIFGELEVNVIPEAYLYELTLPAIGRGLFLIRWKSKTESGTLRYLKLE